MQKRPNNLNNPIGTNSENCAVCQDLLANLERFYAMLEVARTSTVSDWLTVDEVAKELKISKSIVYRIIRKGELKAVDLTDGTEKIAQRGHYRIKRSSLNQYLEEKQVKPLPDLPEHTNRAHHLPKVKNHLGL